MAIDILELGNLELLNYGGCLATFSSILDGKKGKFALATPIYPELEGSITFVPHNFCGEKGELETLPKNSLIFISGFNMNSQRKLRAAGYVVRVSDIVEVLPDNVATLELPDGVLEIELHPSNFEVGERVMVESIKKFEGKYVGYVRKLTLDDLDKVCGVNV